MFCLNRPRQRRRIFHLIEQWELLQQDMEEVEAKLHTVYIKQSKSKTTCPYYYCSWVYHQKMKLISLAYWMGFELELYSEHELPMITWYCT